MQKIKFVYLDEYSFNVCERPVPAIEYLPEWFKEMRSYAPSEKDPNGKKIIIENYESNATAKKCVPMRDSISAGYIVPLWTDVQVKQTDNGPLITWRVKNDVFQLHGNYGSRLVEVPPGYDNYVFKYITKFRIETPKGYSVLVKPPAGHEQLTFRPISAIIDSDKSVIDTNFPVWIKKDFEGIIEKGTPIAQVIPFKRDDWQSEFSWIPWEKYVEQRDKGFASTIINNYIKNIWSKKDFK
jgi:hypothetical protein